MSPCGGCHYETEQSIRMSIFAYRIGRALAKLFYYKTNLYFQYFLELKMYGRDDKIMFLRLAFFPLFSHIYQRVRTA